MINTLDLFAGCGGMSLGFKWAGFDIKVSNDFWEPAAETYINNHKETKMIIADIKNLDADEISKYYPRGVDVIIGGPPCQGFSMCGTRDVFDKRNTLFYEYARLVKELNPYIFVMENVKGILSMKNPEGELIIDVIKNIFSNLGYSVEYKVLNTAEFGVPQFRERVLLVGIRTDLSYTKFSFPTPIHYSTNTLMFRRKYITLREALSDIPNNNSLIGELEYMSPMSEYQCFIRDGQTKIFNHEMPQHDKLVEQRMSFVPQGGNWKNIPEEFRAGGIHSNAYRRLSLDEPSITIKHAYKSMIIHPIYNRCLTIREVARIQSFPDSYIFFNSKTSQYQQLANAVPPIFAKELGLAVKNNLILNGVIKESRENIYAV